MTILLRLSLLVALCALGCRANTPQPLPDAARAGVVLRASPLSLVIRPGSSGRIRFEARDETNQPLADYPVDFAISSDGGDTAGASLSTQHSLTGPEGVAVVEVMVGTLASNDRPAVFSVKATCPGAPAALADITVTTNVYYVEILPVPADGLLGLASVANTQLYFYDNAACADLDIYAIGASYDVGDSITQARDHPPLVAANSSSVFLGVAASGVHAVVGLGLNSAGVVQIGGCVDVPGAALLESEIIRALLLMDHLFPALAGTYLVTSDFRLNPAPAALATIRVAWQQWARCPLDPARLWIDCTIAALGTGPNTCVPVTSEVGTLGNLLLASRGQVVVPQAGTLTSASDTPCHGATDNSGAPSLEYFVDALFANTRGQLAAVNLGAFPTEIAALLDDVRLDSQMAIDQANDTSTFWVEHDLVAVTFPNALVPLTLVPASFQIPRLGLPVTTSSGILATFKAGQLAVPNHGFTLRLGTDARYAFEASSLKSRNAEDSRRLVDLIFGLAQWSDQSTALTGCAALDAVACDQIKRSRGCVADACQAGLVALADNLASVFADLDGGGLDFRLSGSAPVIDLNADGRADALGLAAAAGGVVAGPGLWSAEVETRAGSYVTYGSWWATRSTTTR
jgi:hypothetical protein